MKNDKLIKVYIRNIQTRKIEYVFVQSFFLYFFIEKKKESVRK